MYYIIYRTTNLITGKSYVGKHAQPDAPYVFDGYLGSGKALQHAIKKYGKEHFTRETLYVFSSEQEAYEKEMELVSESTIGGLYNMKVGGKGGAGGLVQVWNKAARKFEMVEATNVDDSIHEKRVNPARQHTKNHTHIINTTSGIIRRHNKSLPVPPGWMQWAQDIGNTGHTLCHHLVTKDIRFFEKDNIPEGYVAGRPNISNTKGKRYINNGVGKTRFINKDDPLPHGWCEGRGQHKSCEYLWYFNPNTKHETKLSTSEPIPDGYLRGRAPKQHNRKDIT